MSEKRKKLIHIHSNVVNKQPKANVLENGEIAVNYAQGKEFLSFKNTENKVVRVSSDEQMVTWMEKKEVMPVSGGTVDKNLLNNKSNVKIVLNQVAAKNTPSASTVNSDCGFRINMDSYAMIGANPSFSSVTVENGVTAKTVDAENITASEKVKTKDLDVTSNANITGATNISGATKIDNDLTVTGDVNISGNTKIAKNLTVTSGITSNTITSNSGNITSLTSTTINATNVNVSNKTTTKYLDVTNDVNISGKTNISGATTINGSTTINNDLTVTKNVYISGDTKIAKNLTVTSAITSNSITSVNGNITNLTSTTINATSGNVTYLTANTISAQSLDIEGEIKVDLSGCPALTSTTLAEAFCEVMGKGEAASELTMKVITPAAESEILKTYQLFQNGAQVGEDINIPKDHLLKSASVVYGKVSGSNFTACTDASSACHWYIKLVFNVFDPSSGHADDATVYVLADDFIKDIVASNPTSVTADPKYNNIAVNVWYDGEKNRVSADTTPTIHVSGDLLADELVSGQTVSGVNGYFNSLTSTAFTSNTANITNLTANTISANTFVANSFSASSVDIDLDDLNLGKLKITSNGIERGEYDPAVSSGKDIDLGNYLSGSTMWASGATQGGAAVSANKLNTNAGSATQPVYFSDGIPVATTYSLSASVPSDAKFSDTTYAAGRAISITGTTNSINFTLPISAGTVTNALIYNSASNVASGDYSHAEGYMTLASGGSAHAEGNETSAIGMNSHAEGNETTASGVSSHAEGESTEANGHYSHAEGNLTIASGASSHAEGWLTKAKGIASHAEGENAIASGASSHAEGSYTIASGADSHAEGSGTTASGSSSHAEGFDTKANSAASHAEGYYTIASGEYSHAEGNMTKASGNCSHAEGDGTTASGWYSHAEGVNTTASGSESHAEGNDTTASGTSSHAEGRETTASGNYSHAEGFDTSAMTTYSHAEGWSSIASGTSSHAEGTTTRAIGSYSHAEGLNTKASGTCSHAEGSNTQAIGNYSHAEGTTTIASGSNSHAEGYYTVTNNSSEHASGQYNVSSKASDNFGDAGNTLFSVGNGTADDARHNAFEIRQNGDVYVDGKITATGAIYSSDRDLKENIGFITTDEMIKVKNIPMKSFNFKDDESKRKTYGVIAQEVQDSGLEELIHTKNDGKLGVDYTSLLILKIAYLEDYCNKLNEKIKNLESKG